MKVNLIEPKVRRNVHFEGYQPVKSNTGKREFEFNYAFDPDKYDCYLELFSVDKDENGNYYTTGILENFNVEQNPTEIKIENGLPAKIDISGDYGIAPDQAFAYHYKLYPKNNKDAAPMYKLDAGMSINESITTHKAYDIYNIVPQSVSTLQKGGAMKLIVPDMNNVLWVYNDKNEIVKNPNIDKARKTSKNFANKIGGTLAGVEKDCVDGKFDNFKRIITTPLFTDDSLSAHAYWNKNCFQMAHSLGNINNYTSLWKKLFPKGINLVADGTYVNEGLEGIHFKHVLRWGENSPYFHWFNISGLDQGPLKMGVFGKNNDNTTHRLVNSPYKFEQLPDGQIKITSQKYDKKAPTYIQIYDKRLVNAENLSDRDLIKAYDKLPENNLEINNHNDVVIPYSFRINPETYKQNIEKLNEQNKVFKEEKQPVIDFKSPQGTKMVAEFEYFGLDGKQEGGFETWDANVDIARLAYTTSHAETAMLKGIRDPYKREAMKELLNRKHIEVQDYAVSSGKFWSKKTNQILNLYAAQNLKNLNGKSADEILSVIKNHSNVFPKNLDVNSEIIENVLNGQYELSGNKTKESYDNLILQGLMDVPLDSIESGDDIAAVLASPYMTKRAVTEEQIGLSRFDMFKQGNPHLVEDEFVDTYKLTDKMYTKEMSKFAKDILTKIEQRLPNEQKLHDANGNPTEFGKYVIPLLTAEIARFAVIKAISPKVNYSFDKETGELTYDYKALKNTSLLSMGIVSDGPQNEAELLISKLRSRINKIKKSDRDNLTEALYKSIQGTNAESFKLAEMIVKRSGAGLDWRIDATKDIADIESVRRDKTAYRETWDKVIKFWSKFNSAVKEYHPDVYIAAEVTDEMDGFRSSGRFSSTQELVKKLVNEAGFTTTANYTYFSSEITKIFGKLFDYDGENSPDKGYDHGEVIVNQLVGGGDYLNSAPLPSLLYSYTFAGNHDKCRALEGFAVDMDMVYTDLTNHKNYDYRKRAYKILNAVPYGTEPSDKEINTFNFNRISNLAVAKSESILSGMGKASHKVGFDDNRTKYVYGKLLDSLKNLSNGIHKGKIYEADGFGTKDFNIALDIVFDEMDYLEPNSNNRMSADEKKKLKNKALEEILKPAMSKLLGQTKFLTALVGNPTLFAGDEYGATGYETKSKNIYLQNRNIIHEEWADSESPDYKEFIKEFKNKMDSVFELRTRKELHPLNDGTPIALKEQRINNIKKADGSPAYVSALLRHSTDGAMTISVFNTEGLNHNFDQEYNPAKIQLDSIDLSEGRGGKAGLAGGLKPGTKFINAEDENDVYYVNGNNQLTRPEGMDKKPIGPIEINKSVLILYSKPTVPAKPTFTGRRTLYNPQYNFVSKPYENKKAISAGSKLSLISQ